MRVRDQGVEKRQGKRVERGRSGEKTKLLNYLGGIHSHRKKRVKKTKNQTRGGRRGFGRQVSNHFKMISKGGNHKEFDRGGKAVGGGAIGGQELFSRGKKKWGLGGKEKSHRTTMKGPPFLGS